MRVIAAVALKGVTSAGQVLVWLGDVGHTFSRRLATVRADHAVIASHVRLSNAGPQRPFLADSLEQWLKRSQPESHPRGDAQSVALAHRPVEQPRRDHRTRLALPGLDADVSERLRRARHAPARGDLARNHASRAYVPHVG